MSLPILPRALGVDIALGQQQIITAGTQFTGVAPGGVQTYTNKQMRFASSTTGGLFYFQQVETVVITDYYFDFGGTVTTAKLYVCDVNATTGAEVANTAQQVDGAASVAFLKKTNNCLILSVNQALKMVTTGGTGLMIGTVFAMHEKGIYGT